MYFLKVVRLFFSRSLNKTVDMLFNHANTKVMARRRCKNFILMLIIYIKFCLHVHMLNCLWIWLGMIDYNKVFQSGPGWLKRYEQENDVELSMFEIYVDSNAFMIDTISKVGYGNVY